MQLIEINWQPDKRQLRQFGGLCVVALPLIAWIWSASTTGISIAAAVGLGLAGLSWVAPALIRPLFVTLMLIAAPIGLVVGELVLLLTFLCVFLPIGLIFRLMRRDRLQLDKDREASSYWHAKPQPRSVASYFRQW